jgi:hypothetical protein
MDTKLKRSAGRPPSGRDDVTVKVPRAIARQVKVLSAMRGEPFGQVLAGYLAGPVARDYERVVKPEAKP